MDFGPPGANDITNEAAETEEDARAEGSVADPGVMVLLFFFWGVSSFFLFFCSKMFSSFLKQILDT